MAAPAFQFYAQDFRASLSVAKMNSAQRGGYIMLLAAAWDYEITAHLPTDEDDLRLFSGMTEAEWEAGRERILKMFPLTEDGALRYNKRLLEEAQKQDAYRQSRAKAGQASAAKRWGAVTEGVTQGQQEGNKNVTRVTPEVTRVTETGNVGVTLRSSSSTSIVEREGAPVGASPAPLPVVKVEKPKATKQQPEAPAAFVAFWDAYPRREGKSDALKAFSKLSEADQQAAADRATRWRTDFATKVIEGFAPHPSTWLNGRRWEDERPAPPPPKHTPYTAPPSTAPQFATRADVDALWDDPVPTGYATTSFR